MHISDLVGQYNKAGSQAEPITKMKGVERLVSSVSELSNGNVFEGTVNFVKGTKVCLGLSNGTQINARISGKVPLQAGQSMFFQVKSNNGTTIEIRPFTVDGNGANLTLLEALKAAGLPTDARNVQMVNQMMQAQMSIDKNSLGEMARLLQNNPEVKVQTLVEMKRLGLEVNLELAAQYENYMVDKQAISSSMNEYVDALTNIFMDESLTATKLSNLGSDVLSIMTENLSESLEPIQGPTYGNSVEYLIGGESIQELLNGESIENNQQALEGAQNAESIQNLEGAQNAESIQNLEGVENTENVQKPQDAQNTENLQNLEVTQERITADNVSGDSNGSENVSKVVFQNSLETIMAKEDVQKLNELVKNLLPEERQEAFKPFTPETSAVEVLNRVSKLLAQNPDGSKENIIRLFSNEGFRSVINNVMEQQWTLKPKDVASENGKINKLFEKIENQLNRLENVIKAAGVQGERGEQVLNTSANIKGNIEFMNQVNNLYTYVQIPLKMSGQNASGQLYVYTNKKNIMDPDKELSAFLHLDLEHMGSTDISIKLLRRDVDTKFYFDNDGAYELVKQFLPRLEEKLRDKGYNCKLDVINEKHSVNFVDDFLKKDMPNAGQLHRYSFDMRA